ncbi:exopolysaccharide biosynthesis protein [Palleronia sp. LCG004]|uniref:exopolysaccharide biosynthesis protein n=1 Tax=Palleronia sp. LCG004 TaxID=3079304 RepID=UPI002941C314|nr:exopolysaccharide biosynthesis protein [Palleronia sp. LCG004]WOI56864.1 exopolysaccharide biosynthesis protein [Palleronia sp. LCG004]
MATPPSDRAHHVRDVIDQLDDLTDRDRIFVSDVVDAFGTTAFLPVMMVPALLVVSPLSGIPLFSSVCGITIAIIASQLFLHRPRLWLPGFMRRRNVSGSRMHEAIGKIRKLANWIDRHSRDRLRFLTKQPGRQIAYGACMMSGFAMPFLEIVPFSSSLMGFAVLCIVAGLLAVDGLFVLIGLSIIGLAATIPFFVWTGLMAGSGA